MTASSKTGLWVALLAAAGTGISGYLTWRKLAGGPVWCAGGASCDIVNASPYAQLGGVPVAALGLGAYLVLLALGLIWWRQGAGTGSWVPLATAGLSAAGWVFSAYLTWLEAYVIYAYCIWCLASFAVITLMVGISARGVLRGE